MNIIMGYKALFQLDLDNKERKDIIHVLMQITIRYALLDDSCMIMPCPNPGLFFK